MSVGYIDTSSELQEAEPTIWVTWLQPALYSKQSLQNQSSKPVELRRSAFFSLPCHLRTRNTPGCVCVQHNLRGRLENSLKAWLRFDRLRHWRVYGGWESRRWECCSWKLRLWTGNQSATSQLLTTNIRKHGFSTEVAEEEEITPKTHLSWSQAKLVSVFFFTGSVTVNISLWALVYFKDVSYEVLRA